MSDGEQAKGQVAEARRFAKKFGLTNITVLIDYNGLQICGDICDIMPVNFKGGFESDGWKTLEIDGHSYEQIYESIRIAVHDSVYPYAIICKTVMGKGVDFMENKAEYHGRALKKDELIDALIKLEPSLTPEKIQEELDHYKELRKILSPVPIKLKEFKPNIVIPKRIVYNPKDEKGNIRKVGCRDAFGDFMYELGKAYETRGLPIPVAAFDCDLVDSVKLTKFARAFPQNFFEAGIQEHNTATIAGALSTEDILVFFADFGVFNIDETYNQHRLNDINHTNLRLISTHIGIDVGADGKTHHCIDYLGLLRNLYGFKVIVPADANETYLALLYIIDKPGNWFIGVGRENLPIITKDTNPDEPFFKSFEYGKATLIRSGEDIAIISMGAAIHSAIEACEMLRKIGINPMVWNFSSPLSPDTEALKLAAATGKIIIVEDHNIHTGLGNIVTEALYELRLFPQIKRLGVRFYGSSDTPRELYKAESLDSEGIAHSVEKFLKGQ